MAAAMTIGARGQRPRARAPAVLLAAGLALLGGCMGTRQPAAEPPAAAAAPATETEAEAPLSGSTNVIHVVPIDGIGGPLRLVLADAVAASLRDTERPAVLAAEANDRGPSIVGRVVNVRPRGSVVWVTTNWALRAPFGTVVAERTREIVVDKTYWDRNSVEVVNLIVGDAMPAVAAMVQDHVGPLHVAQNAVAEAKPTDIRGVDPMPSTPPDSALSPGIPEMVEAELRATAGAEAPPPAVAPDQMAAPELPAATALSTIPAAPVPAEPPAPAGPPVALTPGRASPPGLDAAPDADGLTPDDLAAMPAPTAPAPSTPAMPAEAPAMAAKSDPAPMPAGGIAEQPGDTPVVWGRPSFLIRPVKGAPGDGNRALNEALRAALHGKDLTVTDDPRQAGYEVVGTVDVGPPVNGRQRARIAWVVNTISGEEVGKAVQENVIAAGSLNQAWGRVATIVTAAAADGIQQLFEAPRPKLTPVGAVPDFPKVPALPRVPGRALPPPPS